MSVISVNSMRGLEDKGCASGYMADSKSSQFFGKVLLFFMCGNVALDFIAGILGVSSVSQLIRVCFFAFMLYVELRLDKKGFCLLFVAFSAILTQSTLTQLLSKEGLELSPLIYDVGMGVKFLLSFSVCFSANSLVKCKALSINQIRKAIAIAAVYLPILYLVSVSLGLGESSYWDGSGYKSVFSSLNSINIAMIVLFAYSTDAFLLQKKLIWVVPMALNLMSLMMLGTKSGYIFAFIILMYYLAIPPETRLRNIVLGLLIFILVLLAINYVGFLNDVLSKVSSRQSYLFENRTLIDYITSGRTWMLAEAAELFNSGNSSLIVLFGGGYYSFHHELAMSSGYLSTASVRPIEFDWADLFFSYGTAVVVLVYAFLVAKLTAAWRTRKEGRFQFIALLSLLVFSSVGGHVFFEAISSVTLGSVLACIHEDKNGC